MFQIKRNVKKKVLNKRGEKWNFYPAMGAQQGKERGVPAVPPQHPPPLAGRLGERQGSRIKGLRQRREGPRVGGNIFTEHSGE